MTNNINNLRKIESRLLWWIYAYATEGGDDAYESDLSETIADLGDEIEKLEKSAPVPERPLLCSYDCDVISKKELGKELDEAIAAYKEELIKIVRKEKAKEPLDSQEWGRGFDDCCDWLIDEVLK